MSSTIAAVLLIFVTTFGGQSGTMAFKFDSLSVCQIAKPEVIQTITDASQGFEEKDRVASLAAVCVKPVSLTSS